MSGASVTLTEGHIQALVKFAETPQCEGESDKKTGLFIWGDNDPYFADANAILQCLPLLNRSGSLAGNVQADGILTEHPAPAPSAMHTQGNSGFKPHFITTGLESLYEGVTISDVRDPEQLCVITSSNQKSHVTCLHNSSTHRVLIDSGLTRLSPEHWAKTAGTQTLLPMPRAISPTRSRNK
jgi:hypothetical protein